MTISNDDAPTGGGQSGLLNVPNALSLIRLVGSPVMVVLAIAGAEEWVLWIAVVMLLTDWVDGKLAILLKQQTTFGAKLDSLADVTLYASVLVAMFLLRAEVIRAELAWIVPAVLSYAASALAGWLKFGGVPTYHTRAAKTSWLLVSIAILAVLGDWSVWPLRIAAAGVLLTNLEAIVITLVLPESRVDLPSLYHALAVRREVAARSDEPDSRPPTPGN